MTTVNRDSAQEWLKKLRFHPQFVAKGMEGFVFDVGGSVLAKVWIVKTLAEVQQLHAFYLELRRQHLPFATPLIRDILQTPDGFPVSLEERLPGIALSTRLASEQPSDRLTSRGMAAVVSVVEALRNIRDIPTARDLNLLGDPSLWNETSTWGAVLARLVRRRTDRYKTSLQQSVPQLDAKIESIVSLLQSLKVTKIGVIHGDICTENILVDTVTLTPTALLDFGFLTSSADPLFDAVISTLIYDMYSPHAGIARKRLHTIYAALWGDDFVAVYPLYKAAYALITSNAYSEEGRDGHFKWCVEILNDEETNNLTTYG